MKHHTSSIVIKIYSILVLSISSLLARDCLSIKNVPFKDLSSIITSSRSHSDQMRIKKETPLPTYQISLTLNPEKMDHFLKTFTTPVRIVIDKACEEFYQSPIDAIQWAKSYQITNQATNLLEQPSQNQCHSKLLTQFSLAHADKKNLLQQTFGDFVQHLEENILPVYEKHEQGFDKLYRFSSGHSSGHIHSRMHIARSLLAGEMLCNLYQRQGLLLDRFSVRHAIAWHDSGREANGIDVFEAQSAKNLVTDLEKLDVDSEHAHQLIDFIKKGDKPPFEKEEFSPEKMVAQDTDVLDIMRPCTGRGGLRGFRPSFFKTGTHQEDHFSKHEHQDLFRQAIIEDYWTWVQVAEHAKPELDQEKSHGYMKRLINLFHEYRELYPFYTSLLGDLK